MIYPKTHFRHCGTHEAADLLSWLAAASWRPLPVQEFADAMQRDVASFGTFLPAPNWHWVKNGARVANASARHGHAEWEAAGWKAVALYDLDEVGKQIADVIGLRCRACEGVYSSLMITTPRVGYEHDHAICVHCHRATAPAMQGRNRREVAANLMALPRQLREARHALDVIKERIPPSNAKALAYCIEQIEAALGRTP